jgi:hypothetical protein
MEKVQAAAWQRKNLDLFAGFRDDGCCSLKAYLGVGSMAKGLLGGRGELRGRCIENLAVLVVDDLLAMSILRVAS